MKVYCKSLTNYDRYHTSEVKVGNVGIGGNNPIRVQSMTTTNTLDTIATVEQSIRMIEAGCEIVRITAPSRKEAENLQVIKKELHSRGFDVPLVADIHFTPSAAEIAARLVEKVRINPGNYADKKRFNEIEYTDDSYQYELDKIRSKFIPLLNICKEYGTAMRIGTNHGSLSDRIMSRYGDTPFGMVESAMEFLRICEDENYHQIVLSMKASNPKVMVQAYRLLVNKMESEGMNYPLHLGVTEAGDGEDGRIKSAVGIGTLLEDGLGDTIRVSLTEEPEYEIPVAKKLIARYTQRKNHSPIKSIDNYPINPFDYNRRESIDIEGIGNKNTSKVITNLSDREGIEPSNLFAVGYGYSTKLDKWNIQDFACDYIYIGKNTIDFEIPGTLGVIQDANTWNKERERTFPFFKAESYLKSINRSDVLNFISVEAEDLIAKKEFFDELKLDKSIVWILSTENSHAMSSLRRAMVFMLNNKYCQPVIFRKNYNDVEDEEFFQLNSSTDIGGLLLDGLGDGIWLENKNVDKTFINRTCFGILQATRTRISKTEYISCPSCGRTLFDLQKTTAKIRTHTNHLKGVKIGIMGCIVNGPGEMADADYGYVGTGPGRITLYKEKTVVQKNVPEDQAVHALINLIKTHGDWVEPS